MQIDAFADFDVVAVEQDDVVTLMLELTAPLPVGDEPRPPATVVVPSPELLEERRIIHELRAGIEVGDAAWASKQARRSITARTASAAAATDRPVCASPRRRARC